MVKELVLKANGLCPREFKSRRCRHVLCTRKGSDTPVIFCEHALSFLFLLYTVQKKKVHKSYDVKDRRFQEARFYSVIG